VAESIRQPSSVNLPAQSVPAAAGSDASGRSPVYRGAVIGLAVAETVSWGVLFYAFGVLLPAMESDLGTGRLALTAVFSGALLMSGLVAASVGRCLDRWGPRGVMTVGAVAATGLVVAWSRADSLVALALIWAGIGVCHALVLYEPAFAAVTGWLADVRARAKALLVITLLGGLASTLFLPLTGALLAAHGWRTAVLVLACILAVVTIPIHATLPRGSAKSSRKRTGTHGKLRRGFSWLIAAFALHGFIVGAVAVHAVPLISEAGRTPLRAATMVGLFGVFQVAGRLLSNAWWTRLPGAWRVSGLLATQALAMGALALARFDAAVWVFVAAFGLSNGMLTLARPLAVAEWCSADEFGAVSGRLAGWAQASRALAPLAVSGVQAGVGSYAGVGAGLALLAVLGGVAAGRAYALRTAVDAKDGADSGPANAPRWFGRERGTQRV
jgi:MFS family permease